MRSLRLCAAIRIDYLGFDGVASDVPRRTFLF